jgi:endopolyphosphatase
LVDKFYDVFAKNKDEPDDDPTNDLVIPVIPTFGNNDILPHNIFDRAPNTWTRRYQQIWRNFIPEVQKHSFAQGGWFFVEVIPNHLAVVSLNSLYFFSSNSAVDGCAAKAEPGYRQLDWLRIQLQYLRDRGMKAIITGHVPPARTANKSNWDESCWQKYTLWMHQYRDVIAATLYGHMNTDHFIVQDFEQVDRDVAHGYELVQNTKRGVEPRFGIQSATSYLKDLRDSWTKLPKPPAGEAHYDLSIAELLRDYLRNGIEAFKKHKKHKKHKGKKHHGSDDYDSEIGGQFAERFSISHVSPSVVPNYFPTIRVYEYNITGLDKALPRNTEFSQDMEQADELAGDDDVEAERKKKKKKHRFTVPKPPSKSAPPGPAYSAQSLTLLGFVQYYANLTRINNDSFTLRSDDMDTHRWKDGKHHHGKKPHALNFTYEILYDTRSDKVYNLTDLTTRSYLGLAQRIAGKKPRKSDGHEDLGTTKKKKKNKAWYTFVSRAFVNTIDPDDIEEEFGP